ncbi:hypothetical protein V8E36_008520 [Tilletia maclaganii]
MCHGQSFSRRSCMLQILLFLSLATLCSSFTVQLRAVNETVFLHPNGTLNVAKALHHIHAGRCKYQQVREDSRLCHLYSSSEKRSTERIDLYSIYDVIAPVGQLSVGGQPFKVIFNTAALVSIVDPRAYSPTASPTAEHIGQSYINTFPGQHVSQVSRWRDFTSIGGIGTAATIDLAWQPIFDSSETEALGVCAMSRGDISSSRPLPVIKEFVRARLLDRPVFAFSLSRLRQPQTSGGEITLGSHRRNLRFALLEADPRYAGLWAVSGVFNDFESKMILDSGSSFIVIPAWEATRIFNNLGLVIEQHRSVVMAKYLCKFPPIFQITIGSRQITLSADSVQFGLPEESVHFVQPEHQLCILSIVGEQRDDVRLGLPFFRSAHVAFDLEFETRGYGTRGRVGIGLP